MVELNDDKIPSGTGNFFAVDRVIWAAVCRLSMNAAVAYLVLARGTGRNNRTTFWSVDAIERYTGISRSRARDAIQILTARGFVASAHLHGQKPRYDLPPASEIQHSIRPPLSAAEQEAFDKVQAGHPLKMAHFNAAKAAAAKGWLIGLGGRDYAVTPAELAPEPIWLPNELVTGAANEPPPVELVRQTQETMALRLFIDCYHAQNLLDDGGVNRKVICQTFDKELVGQQGEYVVLGFSPSACSSLRTEWHGPALGHRRVDLPKDQQSADFFRHFNLLVDLGLVEWVPHLFESDSLEAEIIHPLGTGRSDSTEDHIGAAAHSAAREMVTEGQFAWAQSKLGPDVRFVPVLRHLSKAQLIAVARLRYRPKTKLTAAWFANLQLWRERYVQEYFMLQQGASSIGSRVNSEGEHLQHQGCIKETQGVINDIKENKRTYEHATHMATSPLRDG